MIGVLVDLLLFMLSLFRNFVAPAGLYHSPSLQQGFFNSLVLFSVCAVLPLPPSLFASFSMEGSGSAMACLNHQDEQLTEI